MRIKKLNDKFTALGVSKSVYEELIESLIKSRDDESLINLSILNGEGFKVKDIVQCATVDEWINEVNSDIHDNPFTYTEVLDSTKNNLNITKYKNYDLFKGSNITKDCGDVNKLFGNNPPEQFVSALMSQDEYRHRTKRGYISPIKSFNSVWTFLHKPMYILILKHNES